MNKTFKTILFLILLVTLSITISCLNDPDDERTEETERSEISNLLLSLINSGIDVDTTASGLFYIVSVAGTGQVPQPGDTVFIEYIGTYIDGTIFEASYSYFTDSIWEFVYKEQSLIAGFDEAVGMLNTGMEANFIIPSTLAYGSEWFDFIPPYTPLVFYLKLHDLKPKTVE